MANRDDRDILLPEGRDPWRILRDLRALLKHRRKPSPSSAQVPPADLGKAFEYLAAECQAAGILLDDLTETLADKMAALTGQDRFAVQCTLADSLNQQTSAKFFVAMHIATRVPVPQGRRALLQMLTQAHLAHWSFPAEESAGNNPRAFDLRPVVVAALGQLRDPSLLGLFHRLLEKLSGTVPANEPIVAAVQWALMNLAPGSHGEPMPLAVLTGRFAPAGGNARRPVESTAQGSPPPAKPTGNGHAILSQTPSAPQPEKPIVSSERSDLLGGF